jgi:hypothetical protein
MVAEKATSTDMRVLFDTTVSFVRFEPRPIEAVFTVNESRITYNYLQVR